MSQLGGGNTVGRLEVEISAKGAEETKRALDAVKDTGEKAATGVGNKFQELGKSLRSPITAFTRLTGAIAGAVAIATSFYNIGKRIREEYDRATESTSKFIDHVKKSMPETQAQLDTLQKKIVKYEEEVAYWRELLNKPITKAAADDARSNARWYEYQLKLLREQADVMRRTINSPDIAKRQQQAAEDRLKAIEEERKARLENEKEIADNLSEFKRLQSQAYAEATAKAEEFENARREASEETSEDMREFLRLSQKAYQDATAAQEKMRDAARAARDEQREFIRSMRDEIRNALPAEKIVSDLGRIVAQLERIAQQRGR